MASKRPPRGAWSWAQIAQHASQWCIKLLAKACAQRRWVRPRRLARHHASDKRSGNPRREQLQCHCAEDWEQWMHKNRMGKLHNEDTT